jgi:hypothetical protein
MLSDLYVSIEYSGRVGVLCDSEAYVGTLAMIIKTLSDESGGCLDVFHWWQDFNLPFPLSLPFRLRWRC